MTLLANGLSAAEHHEDALLVYEAELSMLRRNGAPEDRHAILHAISRRNFLRRPLLLRLLHRYAQQVAFVEEPLHLSKNFTGLLITIAMIVGATLCCVAARQLLPSPAAATGGYKKTKKWEPYEDEAEPLEGKGGSGPGAGAFSIDEDD